jgi:hypothetical protein
MRSQSPRHRYCRIAISKIMAQAIERSTPSHNPRSMFEIEMENRLVVAHANETVNSAQNRVPIGADWVVSLDICRHYHKPRLNLIDRHSGVKSRYR